MSFTVFYLNPRATDDVLAMVSEQVPAGWRLLAPSHPTDFARELGQCDFLLVADHPVTADHLALAPKLRMIQHQGVGYERIDLTACRARGLPLALAPQGTTVGVAEHTLLLILASFKRLVKAATSASSGQWMQWELRQGSFELAGKVLGLVGLGRIGREVAKRALAFDARVTYFDPFVPHPGDLPVRRTADLGALLGEADVVSLHAPLTKENRHLINAATLRQMRPGALLVNTARGGLVDEPALVEALRAGHLRGAALDVLAQEPPAADNPLLHMENVLVTPHIATGTIDAMRAKMGAVFDNLLRHARGEPLLNVVPELADLSSARG
jgi:phosphoglycerate dehydrogenase-like enzyme